MSKDKEGLSRRKFLQQTALGTAALYSSLNLVKPDKSKAQDYSSDRKTILMDHSLCVKCYACRLACQNENDFPKEAQSISFKSFETGEYPDVTYHLTRWSCFHCNDAPCIGACPVDAIDRSTGEVNTTDIAECIGCYECQEVCPFEVPQIIDGKMYKCNGCVHLLDQELKPACVTTCPTYAISFGSEEEMVKKAKERQKELQGRDKEAYLYGLDAQDGLGLLLLLKTAPEDFQLS